MPPQGPGRSVPRTGFRPELHGVRGLAIALVVVFHVFGQGRVSGGIDAFLAISGFLMTLSLARRLEDGSLRLGRYLARLLRRLLPPVVLVLVAVAAAGAAVLGPGWDGPLPDVPPVPDLSVVGKDLPDVYDLVGCVRTHRDTPESARPGLCHLGPEDATRTVLVTGGSHVAQWMPALRLVAEQEDWQLVFAEKDGCQFLPRPGPGSQDPEQTESCYAYNENLWPIIEDLAPDYLFTIGTTSRPLDGEATPEGFVTQWRRLDELGIGVLAVRDSTRLQETVPECLERTGFDAHACGQPRTERLLATSPLLDVADLPDNVLPIDLTDRICRPDWCRAVEGNVIVYRDTSHVTATYMRTLAPFLRDALEEVAPSLF